MGFGRVVFLRAANWAVQRINSDCGFGLGFFGGAYLMAIMWFMGLIILNCQGCTSDLYFIVWNCGNDSIYIWGLFLCFLLITDVESVCLARIKDQEYVAYQVVS